MCNVGTQAAATASASLAMVVPLDGYAWERSSGSTPTGGVGVCLKQPWSDILCSAEVSAWRQLLDYLWCTRTHAGTEVCPQHGTSPLGNAGMPVPGGDLHLNCREHELGGSTSTQFD